VSAAPQVWRQALPIDPSLGEYPEASDVRPGLFTRFVPVAGQDGQLSAIQTTSVSEAPLMPLGRAGLALKRQVFGPPLDASAIAVERMRKLVALPVLSADALSSVAYGPQAMLAVLVLAGLPGLSYSLPVGAAIVVLMLAVGVSYRQTIRAYPQGGGGGLHRRERGTRPRSRPDGRRGRADRLRHDRRGLDRLRRGGHHLGIPAGAAGVGVIVILLAGNLRGVRQAGAVFAVPTYAFIAAIAALVVAGLVHAAGRGFHPVPVRHLAAVQAVTVLLVLRAFASGSTAMTGIEAISNAVPAFKPVEWRNARITLSWMTGLLIGMFAGVLVITRLAGIVPVASQTMLSQLARLYFGDGPVYIFIQAATAAVLLMAANTSYNDFPRVLFLMARDRQAPRSFLRIGDRPYLR
jgi:fumarate reductase subunit C